MMQHQCLEWVLVKLKKIYRNHPVFCLTIRVGFEHASGARPHPPLARTSHMGCAATADLFTTLRHHCLVISLVKPKGPASLTQDPQHLPFASRTRFTHGRCSLWPHCSATTRASTAMVSRQMQQGSSVLLRHHLQDMQVQEHCF